eukprot:CAMPEP_0117655964 /NCGR_PEP_ID=MMETSP0804-20121206/4553_1 /TAXON_ID=1074897 /ORGANISM="Tetraselmis astigmatica, Strain CCMP880" /LENGTH=159 /DNA_ID=CAMNT_0005462337 /DNA_START=197 /DNA_END=676 /DNA_ORIENTATION=+
MRLAELVSKHGIDNWRPVARSLQGVSARSCRLRWHNQLSPDVKQAPFTDWEDAVIVKAIGILGPRWAEIASLLLGRNSSAVKNRWSCKLKRRQARGMLRGLQVDSPLTLEQLLAQRHATVRLAGVQTDIPLEFPCFRHLDVPDSRAAYDFRAVAGPRKE